MCSYLSVDMYLFIVIVYGRRALQEAMLMQQLKQMNEVLQKQQKKAEPATEPPPQTAPPPPTNVCINFSVVYWSDVLNGKKASHSFMSNFKIVLFPFVML